MDAEAVKAELLRRMESDGVLRSVQAKADKGQADFRDSARWSDRAAEILGEVMRKYVPEMPQGTRSSLCESVLRRQYTDTMTLCTAVQKALDAKLGIHLAAKIPKYPEERVKKAANSLEDPTVSDEVIARRSESASANITRSFHDSFVKDNAGFRASAGLRATIVRDSGAKCCDWCANLDGRYEYGSEPKEVFGRHDNCTCTVTYECGRKRQDVWSKRTWEQPAPDAGAGEAVRFSAEQAREIETQRTLRMPAESGISGKQQTRTGENTVDLGLIRSDEYKQKFRGITGISSVDRQLYSQAVAQLTHRNGTYFEDLVLIDSRTGEIAGRQTQSRTETGVVYNSSLRRAISSNPKRTLISLHNHPTNNPPTGSDLASAGQRGYALGVIATHNGRVFTYKTGEQVIFSELFDATVDKYRGMGYNGEEAIIKTLQEYAETHGVEWSER